MSDLCITTPSGTRCYPSQDAVRPQGDVTTTPPPADPTARPRMTPSPGVTVVTPGSTPSQPAPQPASPPPPPPPAAPDARPIITYVAPGVIASQPAASPAATPPSAPPAPLETPPPADQTVTTRLLEGEVPSTATFSMTNGGTITAGELLESWPQPDPIPDDWAPIVDVETGTVMGYLPMNSEDMESLTNGKVRMGVWPVSVDSEISCSRSPEGDVIPTQCTISTTR